MESNEVGEKPACVSAEETASIDTKAESLAPNSSNESNTNVSINKDDSSGCSSVDEKNVEPIAESITSVDECTKEKQPEEEPEVGSNNPLDEPNVVKENEEIDIDKYQTPEATDCESVHDKCDIEPMDIDEILESLNTDAETVTSSDEYCDAQSNAATEEEPRSDDGPIPNPVENAETTDQNDILPIEEAIDVPSKEALAVTEPVAIDLIHSPEKSEVELQENPSGIVENVEEEVKCDEDIKELEKQPQTPDVKPDVKPDAPIEIDKEDIQAEDNIDEIFPVAECKEKSDKPVLDIVKTSDPADEQADDSKSDETSANEVVNIFDLMKENENLFGEAVVTLDELKKPSEEMESDVPMADAEEDGKLNESKNDENIILPEGSIESPKDSGEVTSNEVQEEVKINQEPVIDEAINGEDKPTEDNIADDVPSEKMEDKAPLRRECLNVECLKNSDVFYDAPEFVINHFHLNKRSKLMYACEECYNHAIESYGELCAALEDKQPLFLKKVKYSELVEIIDSSDEEGEDDSERGETFDAETLTLIENELEAVIKETLERVDIDQQMDWNRQILTKKVENNEKNCIEMMSEMKALQRQIDNMYTHTYNFKPSLIEEVQSLDLVTLKPTQICNETYPPVGELKHPDIEYNRLYYTFRNKLVSRWLPCKVTNKIEINGKTEYKIKFCRERKESANIRMVPRKYLAYGRASEYRLNIGTRVIALFDNADKAPNNKNAYVMNNFYPGIIAEPLCLYSSWRYLVFFDDGYVQYVHHENIRVVCECAENVWELIEEPLAKTFIEGYVKEFKKKRPIVQVRGGQRIQTEVNGKWYNAIVNEVDGSLVQLFFEETKRYEWIYRGSTRLFPLYKKLNNVKMFSNRNEATIEYIVIDDEKEPERSTEPPAEELPQPKTPPSKTPPSKTAPIRTFASQAARDTPQQKQREHKRAVAKKSTAPQPKPAIQHMNNSTIYVDEDKPKGKVVYYTAKKQPDVKKYLHHSCQPSCLIKVQHNLSSYSPLSKPLLTGFERQIAKTKFNKKYVVYRAPCGRRLRDMPEMHKYLRITNCELNVDNFSFDPLIHCLAEYVIESYVMKKPDLSDGIEKMAIQLVNCYDNTMPPPCTYSAKRVPTEGVNLNCDSEFLCGCDCTDDCLDKSKCACWKLTLQGAKYGNPDTPIEDVGYQYKRLNEPVPTGIYECNSRCKCKSSCLNRVVQHPIQLKLQVFKTVNRGWGLRCLNDVPKGSFICCYAGNLLTETSANEAGGDLGDEYFAELDYIEVVENMKEGYEPDVVPEENDSSASEDEDFDVEMESMRTRNDDSDDEFVARSYTASSEDSESRRYRTRNSVDTRKKLEPALPKVTEKRKERNSSSDEDGDEVRQVKNFMASNTMPLNDDPDNDRCKSIREFFGTDEAVYIMDAKKAGNIGRYFNHSCGPNLFVQNVFVDTHDLRFPWVAFFASTHIRAGTELTWNYNYEVGSVPGKVLICQCGDEKCRGRIL